LNPECGPLLAAAAGVFENAIDMPVFNPECGLLPAAAVAAAAAAAAAAGVFENAIDMAHIHYLHNDSFGNSEKPRIHDMTTTRDTFHVEANFR
jgi:hypothetical protein